MASYASRFAQHWARLKYTREGEPPSRDQVGEKLLFASGGINVKDVYSFIALPNRKDFELCFFHEDALRRFMETAYAKSNEVPWSNWTIDSSIAIDTINVVVKFWTGRVSDHDIELFLMRHGDILQAPYKPVDRFGIWYGVRKYKLQLKKDANGHPITLPNSISLGPYSGRVIYSGQRQTCFVCGAPDHQVKECTQMKCWKCGGLGHKAKDCSNDSRCSLCGGVGHTYFKCPHSYSNKAKNQNRARAEDEQQPRQNQQEPQESAREPQTAAQQEPLPDGNNTQCATTRQQLPESGEERSSTAPLRRGTQPVAVGKDEGRLVVGRGRGRGSFISVLRRQEAPGGAQQQAKHTILEGERVTSTIVQQQRPPDVERELKLLCAAEVSLPSTDGGSHSQSSTSSSSSSPNSSGTGEGSGEEDDEDEDDGEVYDSASEEPDSPDIQEFSSEPATIRFCAENIMHTQMQMAKSPRTSTKNVPVTGQQGWCWCCFCSTCCLPPLGREKTHRDPDPCPSLGTCFSWTSNSSTCLSVRSEGTMLEGILPQIHPPVTLLGVVLVLLLLYLLSSTTGPGKEPPGPRPLPLLGNLLHLDLKQLHLSLCELSKKYGSVFTIYLGPKKVVVLAGYKTVKQALVNYAEEFGDREISPIFREALQGHGVLFSNGNSWKEMRRFSLTNLRDFGMGKRGSEEKIIEESRSLIEVFENFKGEPFNTAQPVNYCVSNIISAIVYGTRFDYADPAFQKMVDRTGENIHLCGSAEILLYNMFPWLRWCCGWWLVNRTQIFKNDGYNLEEIMGLVQGLRDTLNSQDLRGFVDSFLDRQQEESDQPGSYYHNNNLKFTIYNLFAAGTDTTATTLRWGLLLMAKYPHIQDQVQEELSRVIGDREPRVEDRRNLPYTDAVIHEIQRLANIVPMSLPHTTSCDVTFQGHFIKKGTTVVPLLTSVLQDEDEWETPHSFNPGHFLDEKGCFIKRDAFMPFSAGRRACLGESLARMELFLFFTFLLQRFRFTPPPGVSEDELDLTPTVGFTLSPSPHLLCAVSRT